MMRSFCTPRVYVRHNYILNFIQISQLFSDKHCCMNNMIELVGYDNFITQFGTSQSCMTIRKADISKERICQSKE